MAVDLAAPPLVGTYGPPGCGKSADKIWAYPDALFFATPGGLTPAISIVGFTPQNVVIMDPLTADVTFLKKTAEAKIKGARQRPPAIVVDDFSMVAHRTARLMAPRYKDGRQMYGAIRNDFAELFDTWRSWGLAVLVDTHEDPLEYYTDSEGKLTSRIKHMGMPDLPGQKASPDMVKAFDIFYRVKPDPMRPDWPYSYAGGPFGVGASDWYTKDRWSVANKKTGVVPLNLGEVLRAAGDGIFKLPRPPKVEEVVEPYVKYVFDTVMSGQAKETALLPQVAKAMVEQGHHINLVRWFARDARARIEIATNRSVSSEMAALGFMMI